MAKRAEEKKQREKKIIRKRKQQTGCEGEKHIHKHTQEANIHSISLASLPLQRLVLFLVLLLLLLAAFQFHYRMLFHTIWYVGVFDAYLYFYLCRFLNFNTHTNKKPYHEKCAYVVKNLKHTLVFNIRTIAFTGFKISRQLLTKQTKLGFSAFISSIQIIVGIKCALKSHRIIFKCHFYRISIDLPTVQKLWIKPSIAIAV